MNILRFQPRIRKQNSELATDLESLLAGHRQGHMIRWEYNSSAHYNDPAGGDIFWDMATRYPFYYLDREEQNLIFSAAQEIATLTGHIQVIAECGPGKSQKICPLLKTINPSKVIGIDVCTSFLDDFERTIQRTCFAQPELIQADFVNSPPYLQEQSLLVCFGSTFFNTPINIDGRPDYNAMINTLKTWKRSLTAGGYILIGQDTNNDPETLNAAYNQPYIKAMTESVWHYAARELNLSGFDPYAMEYHGVWDAKNKVFKHMGVPSSNQSIYLNGTRYDLKKSEAFCQSNSIKLSSGEMQDLIIASGMTPLKTWHSPKGRMALHLMQAS